MTAVALPTTTAEPARRARAVVAAVTARRAARSGALWGYVFGLFVASSALGFAVTYRSTSARDRLAATFGANAGIDAIIGRAHDVATVAGFTAWRSLGVLSIVGSVWGVLTATRLVRGEEEAGRFELLLAGRTTRRAAAGQAMAGLGAGAAVLFALTALITVVVGRSSKVQLAAPRALFLALALVAPAVLFLAVGALLSQLAPTRRRAATYGGALIGVSFALRLIADASTATGWLRWATPLGWVENAEPVAHPSPLALVPIALAGALAVVVTLHLAHARDLGSSVLPERPDRPARLALLSGPGPFSLRLLLPSLLGWAVGAGVMALVMGYIAKPASGAITASATARQAIARLGASGTGASLFLGATLVMVSLLVSLFVAAEVAAARATESDGHLDHLLVRPVRRTAWLAGHAGLVAAGALGCGLVAALSAFAGVSIQRAGLGLGALVAAGCNLACPGLCVLGLGVLVLGLFPRACSAAVYGLVAWSFLVDLVGSVAGLNHWLLDTSLFHQVAAAPAEPVRWLTDGILVGLGALGALGGVVAFARRDLAGA